MGFLDFLKKKPATSIAIPPPPQEPGKTDMPLPADPGQIDWNNVQPPNMQAQDSAQNSQAPQPPSDVPQDWNQPPQIATPSDWTTELETPVKSASDWTAPSTPAPQKDTPMDLPDFSDEDIAALDQAKPAAAELPELPESPVQDTSQDTIDSAELPAPETFKEEPSKFISSSSYFMILNEFKASRKGIRQNDEVIKDAVLRHEQLDMLYKRAASDINAVQEHLIKIDGAL